jgi:hypothetical protein
MRGLKVWYGHYECNAVGCGLFDKKKYIAMPGFLRVVPGFFCWPFSLFVTFCDFFTRNFCKLLFTAERGKVCYFLLLFFTACNFYKLCFYCSRFIVCYFLLLFFTACNFHKLFFIVEKGQGNCFIIFTSGYPLIVSTN